jgi:hypothetical protein
VVGDEPNSSAELLNDMLCGAVEEAAVTASRQRLLTLKPNQLRTNQLLTSKPKFKTVGGNNARLLRGTADPFAAALEEDTDGARGNTGVQQNMAPSKAASSPCKPSASRELPATLALKAGDGGRKSKEQKSAKTVRAVLQERGWEFERRGKHMVFKRARAAGSSSQTQTFTMSCTPSDTRAYKNMHAQLNRLEKDSWEEGLAEEAKGALTAAQRKIAEKEESKRAREQESENLAELQAQQEAAREASVRLRMKQQAKQEEEDKEEANMQQKGKRDVIEEEARKKELEEQTRKKKLQVIVREEARRKSP